MSEIKQKCKRLVGKTSSKAGSIVYQRPISKVDRKREGKTLVIMDHGVKVSLNGHGIRALKRLLKDVGEYGRNVNKSSTKVLEISPATAGDILG